MKKDIYLNIDTIVLRDLGQIDRQSFVEGLQKELSEQLAGHKDLSPLSSSSLKTSITVKPDNNSRQLGKSLGQSLAEVIAGGEKKTKGGRRNA